MELLSFGSALSLDISYLGLNMAKTFAVALTVALLAPALTMSVALAPALTMSLALTPALSVALTPALSMAMALLRLPSLSARDADNRGSDSSLEHFIENF